MKNKILYLFVLVLSLTACTDYLDLVPEKDVLSINSMFEKRTTALEFLTGCCKGMSNKVGDMKKDPALFGADELMSDYWGRNPASSSAFPAFQIADNYQNVSDPIFSQWGRTGVLKNQRHDNLYILIRYCNTFIENADKVYNFTEDERDMYKAEAKATKAWYYLQLVKQYGPIVLVPKNLPVSGETKFMQTKRSHIDTCFNRIAKLFEEAIPHLPHFKDQQVSRYGFMNKEAAACYRAKALLFAASPFYNGNAWYTNFKNFEGEPLFNTEYDHSKWERAADATDEALKICKEGNRELYVFPNVAPTEKLGVITTIQRSVIPTNYFSDELIFGVARTMNTTSFMPRWKKGHKYYKSYARGNMNPTMRMVELFYTENGLPLNMDKYWSYEDRYLLGEDKSEDYHLIVDPDRKTINLHLKREPRFYADIACDNCTWLRGITRITMRPYQGDDHGYANETYSYNQPLNATGYWCKKMIASQAYLTGGFSLVYNYPHPAMRLADVYLMQAEAWNEAEGPSEKVYNALNKVRKRAGIPTVQESWSVYSKSPNKIKTKEGMREIIRQERMIELAFEGHRFWDLRRWKTAHEYMNKPFMGWNAYGKDAKSFYNNFEGPIEVWDKNKFEVPRDYLWPLRDEEILTSNNTQNPGW